MAKKIMQFRYYGDKQPGKNQPSGATLANYVKGSVFNGYTPIVQLGIQALPGTKFYLNNSLTPIVIGSTGIYELDLDGVSEITDLRFEYNSMNAINLNSNAYLIVDTISEEV